MNKHGLILESLIRSRINEEVSSARKNQLKRSYTNMRGTIQKRINIIKNKDEAMYMALLYRYGVGKSFDYSMTMDGWKLFKRELENQKNIKLPDIETLDYEEGKEAYFHKHEEIKTRPSIQELYKYLEMSFYKAFKAEHIELKKSISEDSEKRFTLTLEMLVPKDVYDKKRNNISDTYLRTITKKFDFGDTYSESSGFEKVKTENDFYVIQYEFEVEYR